MKKKYTISLIVSNKHGVLTRIAGLFAKRAYNIDNLSVGKTDNPEISRMTIVSECDDFIKEQIVKQLMKLIDVKHVKILEEKSSVQRELTLIKIQMNKGMNSEIMEAINIFRAKVLDLSHDSLIVEITGQSSKIDAFIDYIKKYGIIEMSRTGLTALDRGFNGLKDKEI